MEFNSFIWKLYRDSDEGRAAIARNVSDHLKSLKIAEAKAFYTECSYFEVFDDDLVENGMQGVEEVDLRDLIREHASDYKVTNIDDAEKLFIEIADEGVDWSFEKEGKEFQLVFG